MTERQMLAEVLRGMANNVEQRSVAPRVLADHLVALGLSVRFLSDDLSAEVPPEENSLS